MQAIFILSLFSLIFLLFSGMATGLSKSLMQANVERVESVTRMFFDIETVLTKVIFKEKTASGNPIVDLKDSYLTDLKGDFLAGHLSFSKNQLQKDPWNNKIHIVKTTEKLAIWGAPGGQIVKAPVTTFMLISAGPNERYDFLESISEDTENPVLNKSQILSSDLTDESIVRDDIILRFSNYDAMLDLWQRAEDVDIMVKNVALDYYKNLVDAFSPLIQLSQRDKIRDGVLKEGIFDDLDPTVSYAVFESLGSGDNDILTNEWYTPDNDPSKESVNDVLIDNFRIAKTYNKEFVLAQKPKLDSSGNKMYDVDGNAIMIEDTIESKKLNDEFLAKYPSRLFLYPSFDVLEKDSTGTPLPTDKKGFVNLGLTNMNTLDPFAGVNGEITYVYDPDKPAKIRLKRYRNDGAFGWTIKKEVEIDALGGL